MGLFGNGGYVMGRMNSKTFFMLMLLVTIWGATWPINKAALSYTPPLIYASFRALLGGFFLIIVIWKTRDQLKWHLHWKKYCISAVFNTVLYIGLQTVGLGYLPGGLFSVIVLFNPIIVAIMAHYVFGEPLPPIRIAGLILGFIGIAVVSLDGLQTHVSVIGVVLALLSALTWSIGVVYVKKVGARVNGFWMVAMQSVIGGAVLFILGIATESMGDIVWTSPVYLLGVIYGATLGVPVAYIMYYSLMNAGEASVVGAFTFLIPIISVILGVIFLGEELTTKLLVGLVLIGSSIFLVNYTSKKKRIIDPVKNSVVMSEPTREKE